MIAVEESKKETREKNERTGQTDNSWQALTAQLKEDAVAAKRAAIWAASSCAGMFAPKERLTPQMRTRCDPREK